PEPLKTISMKSVLIALTTLLAASAASASIAVFSDGRNMKIDAYEVEEDTIHLTFSGGAKISMALTRIERIVDDEVSTPEVVEEVKKIVEEGVFPRRSWTYSEDSQPLFQTKYDDIIIETAKHFGVTNSFDARQNIHAGTRYLRWLLKTFDGNADLAVAAYNAGEGNVWKYEGVPPFRETVTYINRIAKHIRKAIDTKQVTVAVVSGSR